MPYSPTIIAASLNDEELKKSIDGLVTYVNKKMGEIGTSIDNSIKGLEQKLRGLGNININTGSASDGGSSRRKKKQEEETQAVKETTVAYDQLAQATGKSAGRMTIMETYDMRIKLLIERLKEVRADIDIFNSAIGSGKATQVEWGQRGLKEANAEAERLMRIISNLESKRDALNAIMQPQGHTIQNYVQSLQKVNPELALLNQQYKNGTALLQQKNVALRRSAQEEQQAAQESAAANARVAAYIEQGAERERQRRAEIQRTGQVAQESANQIMRSMYDQMSQDTETPIGKLKELSDAVMKMQTAYYDMSISERESPIGRALAEDIERANKAITIVQKYNKELFSAQQAGAGEITKNSSLRTLQASLKDLTEQYNRLTVAEIDAGKDTGIRQKYQDISRAAQILQRNLSRPVSFAAAIGLDENTLDNIAYKIRQLQAYKQGIDLTKPTAAQEIKEVDEAITKLEKDMQKYTSQSKSVLDSNNALARSWNYMKNRLAFYFTVGASTAFFKNLIEVRSQYEMNERALGILINSAERGTQIFKELSEMALVSPYTLIELSSATKQLVAYGVAAKDAVDTTRRLADMAAAVGMPMERLTYALGQIKAYGYLNSRDARMFANVGIPLVKQLADYYTELEGKLVSTGDVYDRMKKKAVDYNDVMQVINKMTDEGGKFFNFQAKMAETLKVQLANLTLAWNNMLNEIGASNQGVIVSVIKGLKSMFLAWKSVNSAMWSAAWATGIIVAVRALNVALVKLGFQWRILSKDMTAAAIAGKRVASSFSTIGASIGSLAKSSLTWWSLLAFAIVDAIKDISSFNEAQENLNKSIRDGAKDNYQNVVNFLGEYNKLHNSLYKTERDANGNTIVVPQNIDTNEANKAWEAMREQIELTTKNSDAYISSLLEIENVSERLRRGFAILDDIQVVSSALKEIDEETIKISPDMSKWWNLWTLQNGLIENLKEYENDISDTENYWEKIGRQVVSLANLPVAYYAIYDNFIKDSDQKLDAFREDLKVTTDSIINFIELKGWSGDTEKINEVFSQVFSKIALDYGLNPQEAFQLQLAVEEARAQAAKQALEIRLNDEAEALKLAETEEAKHEIRIRYNALAKELDDFEKFNGASRVYWNDFTKWMKEQHISEMSAMFRDMDAEQIKSLNFQEGKYAEWVNELVTKYANEHKLTYDEAFNYLKNWVSSADQWSIFIPLIIGTGDKKSVYEHLGEYDKVIDEADAEIERLTTRIEELNAKMEKSEKETRELEKAEQELAQAKKDKAEAEAKGGHGKKEKKEKKDEKDAKKDAKKAESELQKALKEELSLIDKVRSNYKKLTKEGVDAATALSTATSGFDETVERINNVLGKYGIGKIDLTKYAGVSNPKAIMEMLQAQLDALSRSGLAKTSEIKDLQVKLQDLKVESLTFDQQTLTQSLNSELSKLKDEYELAVELDANPELGGVFADMMGLSKEELDKLPRDFEGVVRKLQTIVDKQLGMGAFDVRSNLNKDVFDQWVKANKYSQDSDLVVKLKAITDYANKVRQDETKKQIEDWNKLLEKYAEYEYKRTQITQEAEREREAARKKGAPSHVMTAIDMKEAKDLAKVNIEEFQQSSEWITATGDLVGLTDEALGLLIRRIEEFKKSQKYLDAKQIKQLNNALKQLYQQQRKGNPFLQLSNAIRENKMRREEWRKELEEDGKIIEEQNKKIEEGTHLTEEETKTRLYLIGRIKELKEGLATLKDVTPEQVVEYLTNIHNVASQATGAVSDMMKAFGNTEDAEQINKVMSTIEKGLQFALMGAAIGGKSAGGWGAAIGGVIGLLVGGITAWADEISGNADITRAVEKSELSLKRLEISYKRLDNAIENAYGTGKYAYEQLAIANKKLQLAELERQLRLEQSRNSKNYDKEKIISIQEQIEDLKLEIKDATKSITEDLLGITSVGDAAENMVMQMINAFRAGDDYMGEFSKSFEDMINNMIMKTIASKVIGDELHKLFKEIEKKAKTRGGDYLSEIKDAEKQINDWENWIAEYTQKVQSFYIHVLPTKENNYEIGYGGVGDVENIDKIAQGYVAKQKWEDYLDQLRKLYDQAIEPRPEDISELRSSVELMQEEVKSSFETWMNAFGIKFGMDAEAQSLSNLQQGISAITEDTAGALEAMLNGISQQVYLHSSQLEEIKALMQGWDFDVSLGTMSQILLQLQSSYQVQMTIQNTLLGWSSPNGMSVRVEMI